MSQKRYVDIAYHLRHLLTQAGRLIDTNDDIVERALLCINSQTLEVFNTTIIAEQLSFLRPMRDELVRFLNRCSPAELRDSDDLNRANGMIRRLEADEILLILLEELMQIRRELNDIGGRMRTIRSELPNLEQPQFAIWSSARADIEQLKKRLLAILRRAQVSQRSGRGLYLAREIEAARRMVQLTNDYQRQLVGIDSLVRRERFFQVRNRAREVLQTGSSLHDTFFDDPQVWISLNPEVTDLMLQLRRWIRDFNLHNLEPLVEDLQRLSRAIGLHIEYQESHINPGEIWEQINRRVVQLKKLMPPLNDLLRAAVEYEDRVRDGDSLRDVSVFLGLVYLPHSTLAKSGTDFAIAVLTHVIDRINKMAQNIFAARMEITTEPYLRIPGAFLQRIDFDTEAAEQTVFVDQVLRDANLIIEAINGRIKQLRKQRDDNMNL